MTNDSDWSVTVLNEINGRQMKLMTHEFDFHYDVFQLKWNHFASIRMENWKCDECQDKYYLAYAIRNTHIWLRFVHALKKELKLI